jgi:hypothetical protein
MLLHSPVFPGLKTPHWHARCHLCLHSYRICIVSKYRRWMVWRRPMNDRTRHFVVRSTMNTRSVHFRPSIPWRTPTWRLQPRNSRAFRPFTHPAVGLHERKRALCRVLFTLNLNLILKQSRTDILWVCISTPACAYILLSEFWIRSEFARVSERRHFLNWKWISEIPFDMRYLHLQIYITLAACLGLRFRLATGSILYLTKVTLTIISFRILHKRVVTYTLIPYYRQRDVKQNPVSAAA